MRMTGTQSTRSLWRQVVLASSVALYLVLILTVTTFASTVTISDQAGVLNQSQVRKAASALGYPVSIYTMNGFSGSTQQFNNQVANILANHRNMVVVAIDTNRRYMVVQSGPDVPLTTADAANARQAFSSSFNGGNYTAATVSCLNSLKNALATRGTTSGGGNNNGSWFSVGSCLVGLLVITGLLFFVWSRKRRAGLAGNAGFGRFGSLFNRQRPANPVYNPPYQSDAPRYQGNLPPYQDEYQGNPPPRQGNVPPYPGNPPPYQGNNPPYPPNYGPNYGSGYPPQRQGMNPLAAGGLGAAAGGLLGYELGKSQGDRGRQDEGNSETGSEAGGFFGGGEDAGNESGGSFGGGDRGGDFGGSGDGGSGSGDFFGGSDAGSDSGGFFGGSEDSGSGSGGNF